MLQYTTYQLPFQRSEGQLYVSSPAVSFVTSAFTVKAGLVFSRRLALTAIFSKDISPDDDLKAKKDLE
jgi:hypothetical protein